MKAIELIFFGDAESKMTTIKVMSFSIKAHQAKGFIVACGLGVKMNN